MEIFNESSIGKKILTNKMTTIIALIRILKDY